LPRGKNFSADVELKNISGEDKEIVYIFLFWPRIPNWHIFDDWGGINIDPPEPQLKFFEASSVLRNIGIWGNKDNAWSFGSTLEPGIHELRFTASFYLKGDQNNQQETVIWSNTVMLTVQ